MNSTSFAGLKLDPNILRALEEEGYAQPTPIQQAAIPELLGGKDLLATAQTGTGKTAAFALPILHVLKRRQRKAIGALILTPTRELALQIDESLRCYGRHLPLRSAVLLGGVSPGAQIRALRQNPDVLVATPGRLLDLMQQGHARFDRLAMLVLDEADRMLDMGFVHDVRRIVDTLPKKRQTMLFSATLATEVEQLAADMLRAPVRIAVTPPASVSGRIDQQVIFVEQGRKRELLTDVLQGDEVQRALVFTRTKHRANRLMRQLTNSGINADAIHSNKSQSARQRALAAFDQGRVKVLIATDIVARGIDVEDISHVINYELPHDPESYVHRIGRTARAGADGIALSFCDAAELPLLKGIERLTQAPLTMVEGHDFYSHAIAAQRREEERDKAAPKRGKNGGQRRPNGQENGKQQRLNGRGNKRQQRRADGQGASGKQSVANGRGAGKVNGAQSAKRRGQAPRRSEAVAQHAAPETAVASAPQRQEAPGARYGRRARPAQR